MGNKRKGEEPSKHKYTWTELIIAITAICGIIFSAFQTYYFGKDFDLRNRPFLKFEITKFEGSNLFFNLSPTEDRAGVILDISGQFSNWGNLPATNVQLKPFEFKFENGEVFPVEPEHLTNMIVYPGDKQPLKLGLILPSQNIELLMKQIETCLRKGEFNLLFTYNSLGNKKKEYWVRCIVSVSRDEGKILRIEGN